MITELTDVEMWEIASLVERHHEVFYTLFTIGGVVWCDETETLGVHFPKKPNDSITIHINKTLWDTLPEYDKEFILCHECLHVLLQHSARSALLGPKYAGVSHGLKNIAQDIVINELLLGMFGFSFEALTFCAKGCFVRTVFPDKPLMPTNKEFTFYLDLLIQKQISNPGSLDPFADALDQHEAVSSEETTQMGSKISETTLIKISEMLGEKATELNQIVTGIEHSKNGTGDIADVVPKYIPAKPFSFHQHIKDLKRSRFNRSPKLISTFTHSDRRYATLAQQRSLQLPGHIEEERVVINKLHTMIFMDVSGSCVKFVPDFYKMFGHIESFSEFFDISTFTFNTQVTQVDLKKRNLVLGGGTDFQIIESECLKQKKYPDLVIVITDGHAPRFTCSRPENWMWFLITPQTTTNSISKQAKIIMRSEIQL